MIWKSYKNEILLICTTLSLVGIMILFNDVNIQIRIRGIKLFLQKSNRADSNIDHIGLVMKYRLNRQLYDNRISPEKSNLVEMRVNAMLSERDTVSEVAQEKYSIISVPVLHTINFIRYIIGLTPIRDVRNDRSGVDLEIAYYYERNKKYEKAIDLYDTILKEGTLDRSLAASIYLHRGFCNAVLGRYTEAKNNYDEVISDYGDSSVAVTAVVLLRYLEGFRSEAERIKKYEKDSLAKSEKLFRLIAYRESFATLKKIEKSVPAARRSRIKLIKGRVLEELDKPEKAVKLYQDIIMKDPDSPFARSANRRIYLVGSLAINGRRIKTLARKNNQLLEDETFSRMIEEEKKFSPGQSRKNNGVSQNSLADTIQTAEVETPVFKAAELKEMDILIKKINRKIEKKRKTEQRRKGRRVTAPLKVKIYMRDGNIFTGHIMKETDTQLILKTSIGRITINKKKISRRIYL